jgi:hypothetical protein
MGYLTPDNDATLVSRVVFVPDDAQWMAIFWGLLMTLSEPGSWTENGSMSPDEAAARWSELVEVSINANPNPG